MKIHYTREQSEINRRKIYDYVAKCLNNKIFKFAYQSDFVKFKYMICKYNKNYIWFEFVVDTENVYAPYYDIKEKKFTRLFFIFDECTKEDDIKFEERKTIYEQVKDKIEAKKSCIK